MLGVNWIKAMPNLKLNKNNELSQSAHRQITQQLLHLQTKLAAA